MFQAWSHSATDMNWSMSSYAPIGRAVLRGPRDVLAMLEETTDAQVCGSMLFVMKHGVEPRWEHEANVAGGYFSVRLPQAVAPAAWREFVKLFVCERLSDSRDVRRLITGVTGSPKAKHVIFKIYMRNHSMLDAAQFTLSAIPCINTSEMTFYHHGERSRDLAAANAALGSRGGGGANGRGGQQTARGGTGGRGGSAAGRGRGRGFGGSSSSYKQQSGRNSSSAGSGSASTNRYALPGARYFNDDDD
jgi:hypothetical protein